MEVIINKLDDLGQGITKIQDKICFVEKGLPNETLDIFIIKDKKNYSNAKINKIINPNLNRINTICKFYDKCGGCNFLHTTHELEKNFKIDKCLRYFNTFNKFYHTKELNYRNKVTLHVLNGKIGYYQEKSHELVSINNCYLLEDKINQIIKLFLEKKDKNFNGTIVIRNNYNQEILVNLEGNYQNINYLINSNLIDNLIVNDQILKGNNYFYEKILDFKFKVSYKSFFQVNRVGLEKILEVLKDDLANKNINQALDLYSGTSVLGIFLSKYVKFVTSVEVNKYACLDALENIKFNNILNLKVINGKVEDYIDSFKDIDLVIIDPARRGLDKKTINYLKIIKSKYLIYIACSIDSLKRDLEFLKEVYEIDKINLIDMFPRTNNFECISVLHRKNFEK